LQQHVLVLPTRRIACYKAGLFCLMAQATTNLYMGDYAAAQQGYEQALPIACTLGYRAGEAQAQRWLGEVLRLQGAYSHAQTLLVNAANTAHEIGVWYDAAWALATLVRLHSQLGDPDGAYAWRAQLLQLMDGVQLAPDGNAQGLLACAIHALYTGEHQQALAAAEQGWQLAERFDVPTNRADAAVILGHARAGMNQLDTAATAYEQAVTWYMKLGNAPLTSEPRAGLAQLALAKGDLPQALAHVEAILPVVAELPYARAHTPFFAYMTCYHVLEANHDPRAATVLETAQRLLQEYAAQIPNTALRRSFLQNVAAHRDLLRAGTRAAAVPVPSPTA
jgi:tetratricopeptide (TPR) repeat protein